MSANDYAVMTTELLVTQFVACAKQLGLGRLLRAVGGGAPVGDLSSARRKGID